MLDFTPFAGVRSADDSYYCSILDDLVIGIFRCHLPRIELRIEIQHTDNLDAVVDIQDLEGILASNQDNTHSVDCLYQLEFLKLLARFFARGGWTVPDNEVVDQHLYLIFILCEDYGLPLFNLQNHSCPTLIVTSDYLYVLPDFEPFRQFFYWFFNAVNS